MGLLTCDSSSSLRLRSSSSFRQIGKAHRLGFIAPGARRKAPQLLRRPAHKVDMLPAASEEAAEAALRVPQRSLLAVLAASAVSLLGFTMPVAMLPILRAEYSLSSKQVCLVSASLSAGMAFSTVVLP